MMLSANTAASAVISFERRTMRVLPAVDRSGAGVVNSAVGFGTMNGSGSRHQVNEAGQRECRNGQSERSMELLRMAIRGADSKAGM